MFIKFSVLVLLAVICSNAANPVHQKSILKRRISARQQLAPTPAPTGYPPAGVTPEVPFDLPTETQQPDTVYGPPETEPDVIIPPTEQPDAVYGPPEQEEQEPETVYGPPTQTEQESQPDAVYGPPETELNATEFPGEEVSQVQPSVEVDEEEEAEDVDEAEEEVLLNEDGTVIAISTSFDNPNVEEKPARLVYQRFPQRRQSPTSVPARLRLATKRQFF
ncbi:uncharacterized protein LOC142230130 [Haematobia irritans]|uniref:uncharacterized protein LOC142230130 n=1 Tax=Haematobia irritans TaxID=7368 RepID=UPI003F4FCC29